ncbi:MAG: DUF1800 family protein [Alphaproteobacteria bacterium]
MTTVDAFIAATRFGLGPRPGELAAIGKDPRGWLRAQVKPAEIPAELAKLPPSRDSIGAFLASRKGGAEAIKSLFQTKLKTVFENEVNARGLAMVRSTAPFRERLVVFWANHFTVSAARFFAGPPAGAFEREAIRPNVFGKFADMLLAAAKHPVMLLYLDNAGSIGPGSPAAKLVKYGLNENLAREILELHTLGVKGGYTQADVTTLAKLITGWSVDGISPRDGNSGEFKFRPIAHEPGAKTLLGRAYGQGGLAEGEAALRDLARHPSTATFIATKLARHFVADNPPPVTVARLAKLFRDTDGDLAQVSLGLVDLAEAWATKQPKVKSPHDFAIAAMRAVGINELPPKGFIGTFHTLHQMPFTAPSPAGWPDTAADWLTPEALMRRIEWARLVAKLVQRQIEPNKMLVDSLGPMATPSLMTAVAQAPSRDDGIALVFASAEFQRR